MTERHVQDTGSRHVDNVLANARLEGQQLPERAVALLTAYARGEIDEETYLAMAEANIAQTRHEHESRRDARRAV